jgi:hypothetical protein
MSRGFIEWDSYLVQRFESEKRHSMTITRQSLFASIAGFVEAKIQKSWKADILHLVRIFGSCVIPRVICISILICTSCSRSTLSEPDKAEKYRNEQRLVLKATASFFQALRARDQNAAASLLLENGSLFYEKKDANESYSLHYKSNADWLNELSKWNANVEENTFDSDVKIWGPIATVSQSYVFNVNGSIHHCGVNLIQLVKEREKWRIANIVWTAETTGCAEQSTARQSSNR